MILKRSIFTLQLLLISYLPVIAEEDGKLLYGQMCAACHGMKGEGIGNGVFPPLNGSEWVQGDPNRIAQILLHGLKGPVTVKGNVYNLAMPAQGSLSDEGKVAVVRYLKNEFAGEETKFSLADLQKAKIASEARTLQWTAKELLEVYPLPRVKPPINNLIMEVYHGKWNEIPDFSKLTAVAVEEEHDGLISLKNINKRDSFGLVWLGDLEIPNDGTYELELMADDGAVVSIGDKEVCAIKSKGRIHHKHVKKGKITLEKGTHKIKVQYYQAQKGKGISMKLTDLKVKDKTKATIWLSDHAAPKKPAPVIDLTPTDGKTRMYHNFINGSTHRTMGVGFPQGHNIAFSTQDCHPDLIWKGRFINAGKHWTGRGQGAQNPLSNNLIKLGQGVAWSKYGKELNLKLVGYTMDRTGNPTFNYKATDMDITFSEQYLSSEKDLTRLITINSTKDQVIQLRLAEGHPPILSKQGATINNLLNIDAPLSIKGDLLYSSINLKKGTNTFKVTYSWKK
ncbi:MAG: mono/diheme cytochrome c family protein [Rubritalea sp.]|jgi:mono/diheme cytochrome c family protein